jgi:hypothetical protein
MMQFLKSAVAVAALVTVAAPATAATLTGGNTRVLIEEPFVPLVKGLTGVATEASFDPLIANFPISGGFLDASLAGTIAHDGVGLVLSNGLTNVEAGNFVIDTVQSIVFGDVLVEGNPFATGVALFSFDLGSITVPQLVDLSNPALALFITPDLAGALKEVFEVPDLTGVQFGRAATSPVAAIPEPGTWAMLIAGFGLVGLALRRRREIEALA